MDLPEDSTKRFEDNKLPVDSEGASKNHASGFSPEIGLPRDEWTVEVVPGQALDAANRIGRAFDILLYAAAHPKD